MSLATLSSRRRWLVAISVLTLLSWRGAAWIQVPDAPTSVRVNAGLATALACTRAPSLASSETYAASASNTDVQTAVTNSTTGHGLDSHGNPVDTVCVSAATVTWTGTVTISGKPLTLRGAGKGNTNITDNTGDASPALQIDATATNFVRVTGFSFFYPAGNPSKPFGMISIGGTGTNIATDVAFRIDHSVLNDNGGNTSGSRLGYVQDVFGLWDHVDFIRTSTTGVQSVEIDGSTPADPLGSGYTPWTKPLSIGTNLAVYFEDCTFTHNNTGEGAIDQYGGARVVMRKSTLTGTSVGGHGLDSGNRRGALSFEFYNNNHTNNGATGLGAISQIRGGTVITFNNTYGGTQTWGDAKIVYYRANYCAAYYPITCPITPGTGGDYVTRCANHFNNITCDGGTGDWNLEGWGQLDGTLYDVLSDGSASAANGAAGANRFLSTAPDTLCPNNSGGNCTRHMDGTGTDGYPGRDMPGVTHNQVSAPLYEWNNNGHHFGLDTGNQTSPISCMNPPSCTNPALGGLAHWIVENRDYYQASTIQTGPMTPFDGTAVTGRGVGFGTLANRPNGGTPSCTTNPSGNAFTVGTGVGYFATDVGAQGTFYTCTATNTWTVYYTPYTYPHPLSVTP